MGSEDEETEQSPPPIPPRTSSAHPFVDQTQRPLPVPMKIDNNGQLHIENNNSDSSNSTSSDAPDLLEDTSDENSSDTDSDEAVNEYKSSDFDANSSLPPVPNGTLDLTSPADKQKFSSDEERCVKLFFIKIKIFDKKKNNNNLLQITTDE